MFILLKKRRTPSLLPDYCINQVWPLTVVTLWCLVSDFNEPIIACITTHVKTNNSGQVFVKVSDLTLIVLLNQFAYTMLLLSPVTSNRSDDVMRAQRVSMDELYEQGKHEQDVFIENCQWKGSKCNVNNFKQTITDLGMCHTFTAENDMKVESSGENSSIFIFD